MDPHIGQPVNRRFLGNIGLTAEGLAANQKKHKLRLYRQKRQNLVFAISKSRVHLR
jgi:hypothetical protein